MIYHLSKAAAWQPYKSRPQLRIKILYPQGHPQTPSAHLLGGTFGFLRGYQNGRGIRIMRSSGHLPQIPHYFI